jgi:hypothetical protein
LAIIAAIAIIPLLIYGIVTRKRSKAEPDSPAAPASNFPYTSEVYRKIFRDMWLPVGLMILWYVGTARIKPQGMPQKTNDLIFNIGLYCFAIWGFYRIVTRGKEWK